MAATKDAVVAPVIGATRLPIWSAVAAIKVQLTVEDVAYLEEPPYVPHPIVGLIPYGG